MSLEDSSAHAALARLDKNGQKLARTAAKLAAIRELNTADWDRIEAAVRALMETRDFKSKNSNAKGVRGFQRTLSKIEKVNRTGEYTVQANGLTLKETRKRYSK